MRLYDSTQPYESHLLSAIEVVSYREYVKPNLRHQGILYRAVCANIW